MLNEARRAGKRIRGQRSEQDQANLLQRYIELDPYRPAVYEAQTRDEGIPVWVLVSSVDAADGKIQAVADSYEIPAEAVEAAILFFMLHRAEITARIEGNRFPSSIAVG